ncbi:hypothetical protein [Agromyces sp. ZXT2-6]|uniref:hypothetical protein n=1 Tax=Agromyces sp. ZXT2-6 TaxID=3461153 RepID=UPI00405535CD
MSYPLYPADPNRDPAEPFRKLDTAPTAVVMTAVETQPDPWDEFTDARPLTAEEATERQREAFGGPKVGSGFFGWLIAAATAALLAGLLVAADTVLELDVVPDPWGSGDIGPFDALTIGWIVVGTLLAIVFASFYCGGYVAGRMSRFSGVAQGLVVWLWAVVIAVIVGVVAAVLGARLGLEDAVLSAVRAVPVPDDLRLTAWIGAAVVVVAVTLGGAILGGHLGVRYHRRVDRAGLAA